MHPLTGIGRYTWELARHYRSLACEQPVRFLCGTRWVDDPERLLQPGGLAVAPVKRGWHKVLHAKRLARWRISREISRNFCHGPNYFLPDEAESGVVTVHDLSVFKFPETHPVERIRHFERAFASTLARARHLITDSEATRHEVAAYLGWPEERITAIKLGVSDAYRRHTTGELAEPLGALGLHVGKYALCVSTLEPRKRVDKLIQAYARLPRSLTQRYPLVLVGGKGWLNETLLAQIAEAEQAGWLRYLGFVPEASLPAIYAGARAFFFPSIYEGFGLPVLEALASGVPALTSNSTSLPEVAGGAAWLVEPDHDDALVEGIERVLTDDGWRAGAIRRGLDVAAHHRWPECGDRTLALCRELAQ